MRGTCGCRLRAAIGDHDIGGSMALRWATLFPYRVASLRVLNTACSDSWPIEVMVQFGHLEAYHRFPAATAMTLRL